MRIATLLLLLVLASCGGNSNAPTVEENRQLDEAGQMLNEAPENLEAIDDYGLGNEANEADAPL